MNIRFNKVHGKMSVMFDGSQVLLLIFDNHADTSGQGHKATLL